MKKQNISHLELLGATILARLIHFKLFEIEHSGLLLKQLLYGIVLAKMTGPMAIICPTQNQRDMQIDAH